MQPRSLLIMLLTVSVIAMIFFQFAIGRAYAHREMRANNGFVLTVSSITPTASALATPSLPASMEGMSIDLNALIGSVALIVAAIITGVIANYGARLQQKRDQQHTRSIREEQDNAAIQEAVHSEKRRAQDTIERAKAYRQALHDDPHIARLQILDMSRPLEIANVYVRVRVHADVTLHYDVDPLLSAAETQRDPHALLQAGRIYLKRRLSTALEPDEAIREYRRCVIVGDPGAGKTTLLKVLTLNAADNKLTGLPDLPIHIALNVFAASSQHQDLLSFAAHEWETRYAFSAAGARAYMDKMLKEGKALLLLDALDETFIGERADIAEASYRQVSDAIIRLATRYPKSPIIVSARKAGYQERMSLTGFTELEMVDFGLEDIQEFVTKWFAYYKDPQKEASAKALNAQLLRSPRIQALASNPLLLSLIVLVYERRLDLPERRAELYKRCIDVLLAEWDARRNIPRYREFKPEHKQQLLAEIAWLLHTQGKHYIRENELLAEIAHFLPALGLPPEKEKAVLREIANENGLLKEQAHGWYSFLHITLQEYFVSLYVNDQHELANLLTHNGDPRWEEVLLLYAGHTPDASPLFQQLLGHAEQETVADDLFHTNLILAGRCLASHPTIRQVSLRDEVIARLFDLLGTTHYTLTKNQVSEVLAEIGAEMSKKAVTSRLLDLLNNQQTDREVRASIVTALVTSGERPIKPELFRLLSNRQEDPYVRRSIATSMGASGESSVIPELLKLLGNKQEERSLRRSAATALGALGDRSVVPELLKLLGNKQGERYIRRGVAAALGMLGDRSVVPELLALLSDTRADWSVRASIAAALGVLGDQSVVPQLLTLLADGQIDREVRGSIAAALGVLGVQSVVSELLILLADEKVDWEIRGSIAETLGGLGDRSVVPELLKLLENEDVDVEIRASIAAALGVLEDQSIVFRLLELLDNKSVNDYVREGIATALGQLAEDKTTVDKMTTLLQTSGTSNALYNALWNASRRASVKVGSSDEKAGGSTRMNSVEITQRDLNTERQDH